MNVNCAYDAAFECTLISQTQLYTSGCRASLTVGSGATVIHLNNIKDSLNSQSVDRRGGCYRLSLVSSSFV